MELFVRNSFLIKDKVELIGIEKYKVYKKYDGDYDLMIDYRTGDKRDITKISKEEWKVIELLTDNICSLNTGYYSKNMENQMLAKIREHKQLVIDDVFSIIKGKSNIDL